jgi:hypothetical protein
MASRPKLKRSIMTLEDLKERIAVARHVHNDNTGELRTSAPAVE